MAAPLKVRRMQKASSDWITAQPRACRGVTCPEGIGRDLVRATAASKSRSVMSFQVQPAPRIRKAPMAQPTTIQPSNRFRPAGIGRGGQHHAPPAGQQQKPCADGPIRAAEPQVGARARRRERVDPVAAHRVGDLPLWRSVRVAHTLRLMSRPKIRLHVEHPLSEGQTVDLSREQANYLFGDAPGSGGGGGPVQRTRWRMARDGGRGRKAGRLPVGGGSDRAATGPAGPLAPVRADQEGAHRFHRGKGRGTGRGADHAGADRLHQCRAHPARPVAGPCG
jgi:hypothetical protein